MSRLIRLDLTNEERNALEKGFKYGKSHGFRQRCQMILLKSQSKPSHEVAQELGCCMMAVNGWVKRYQAESIEGLQIKKGRGRKTILDAQQDLPAVRRAVQANRQRLSLAQQALQDELGKEFSTLTLKRFLKNIVADTSDFEGE
ncbi:helix-turn-helix domain-containing protein [Armatimonas sp.]|uniref:helix-turn-helix domain-containing protein n=1 Tax=Armatimonas sp. TaxID=1872638 RepID=UPI00286B0623|nr:helix-turn-helix domain-containing protein [Armatimonas sp.]